MKYKFLTLFAAFAISCPAQTKYGSRIAHEAIVDKGNLTISFDKKSKVPNYVGYYLLPSYLKGDAKRNHEDFYPEPNLPKSSRTIPFDYSNTGYDRGHMCPAGDWLYDQRAMHSTFTMANICPQVPELNRNSWKELENLERHLTESCDTAFIITGQRCQLKQYIAEGIQVPTYFYKVFIGVRNDSIIYNKAWLYRNDVIEQSTDNTSTTLQNLEWLLNVKFFIGFWFYQLIH